MPNEDPLKGIRFESRLGDDSEDGRSKTDGIEESDSQNDRNEVFRRNESETKVVRKWRIAVTLVMVVVGTIVTTETFRFLKRHEEDAFESSYLQVSAAITASLNLRTLTIRQSYEFFADLVTSNAHQSNLTWPYVTVPDFRVHAENLRQSTGSEAVWVTHDVTHEQKQSWEKYTVEHADWYGYTIFPQMYTWLGNRVIHDLGPGPYSAAWQMDPKPSWPLVNADLRSHQISLKVVDFLQHAVVGRMSETRAFVPLFTDTPDSFSVRGEPFHGYYQPIYDSFDDSKAKRKALITGIIRWGSFLEGFLEEGSRGIHVVLDSKSCHETHTFELVGTKAVFLENSDLHETEYDGYADSISFDFFDDADAVISAGGCIFDVYIYPSHVFENKFRSSQPLVVSMIVAAFFLFLIGLFFAYDSIQYRRNKILSITAAESNALVSSLFPRAVRDRVMTRHESQVKVRDLESQSFFPTQTRKVKQFLEGNGDKNNMETVGAQPIADLFPDCTVFFGDIVGFTAWSSVREPSQVFTLLESLYSKFDSLAKRRSIFKVETVGDCYVACAGLPDKRPDHAVAIARFSEECLVVFQELTKSLEVSLGPGTGELKFRIGLHSGPVTAGVLRGERARFQLFGDTMNVAARMESTCLPNRVHLSEETAELLRRADKEHWIRPRADLVDMKGKGRQIQTYWLATFADSPENQQRKSARNRHELHESFEGLTTESVVVDYTEVTSESEKRDRLIEWQVDVFVRFIKHIVARRRAFEKIRPQQGDSVDVTTPGPDSTSTPLKEVKDIIELPEFDTKVARMQEDPESIELGPEVVEQVSNYIGAISRMYQENDFHNFEHASHVSMSVTKLLSRIHMPSHLDVTNSSDDNADGVRGSFASTLHDHTYGITSDPLTQFSVAIAALIHDADHSGVPNTQLCVERPLLAAFFEGKSVAEQNSIVIAWELFMDPHFKDLRNTIAPTAHEMARFRQLVVQAVLATDIVDKELKALRNTRWDAAFDGSKNDENPRDTVNRKATIVIEHLIQASDVAHTMQHWHIYRMWNERFFRECYKAYLDGRAPSDPRQNWYEGELGFFDFYIIPLAKKLKDCGVFGVSSDEYLTYALKNRKEWESRGREVVAEMIEATEDWTTSRD